MNARTLAPGRTQVNFIETRKREHSRKPVEQYEIIEACSPGPISSYSRALTRKPGCFRAGSSHGCALATKQTTKPPSILSSGNSLPHRIRANRINPSPMVPSERGSLQEVAA